MSLALNIPWLGSDPVKLGVHRNIETVVHLKIKSKTYYQLSSAASFHYICVKFKDFYPLQQLL